MTAVGIPFDLFVTGTRRRLRHWGSPLRILTKSDAYRITLIDGRYMKGNKEPVTYSYCSINPRNLPPSP